MPAKRKDGKKRRAIAKMPAKRKDGKKPKGTADLSLGITSTLSPKEVPTDIITLILKNLPVKSILRFKCVSKEWLALLSSPKFVSMHSHQTSQNPRNQSFIIHSIDEVQHNNMSLLNINSTASDPVSLINPFTMLFNRMDFVGSINGVVCLSCPPLGHMILLWNPAMNLYKFISLSGKKLYKPGEFPEKISLGLAYDSVNEDYKIIRFACFKPKESTRPEAILKVRAEVYSANSDSWKRVVKIDSPFYVIATRSNFIAKGIPYWIGVIYEATTRNFSEGLLYYDMRNDTFKHVPVPKCDGHEGTGVRLVEWKGCLGVIVSSPSKDRDNFVDIWVHDEIAACWKKVSSHGPVPLKVERNVQCSKDGVILAETPDGKLVLYDPATNGINKEFCIPEAQKLSFEAFSYAESLVSFKKMEQVNEQDKHKFCFRNEDSDKDAAALYKKTWMKKLEHSLEHSLLICWNICCIRY